MTFTIQQIEYAIGGPLPELIHDYLLGKNLQKEFISIPPDINSITSASSKRSFSTNTRRVLYDVVRHQYENANGLLTPFPETGNNISLLADKKTFTVTTGHQLNLFTGPLYFIYKIASTINLASQLRKANPDFNFVPVYWMASEDHDLEEINHLHVFGKRLLWDPTRALPKGEGVSTKVRSAAGRLKCEQLNSLVEQVKNLLGKSDHAATITNLMRKAYTDGRTLSDATRIFVHELFGKHGLVILDADNPELKKLFADVMMDDVVNHHAFEKVNSTISKLEPPYKIQVHPREINLFYLGENFRSRIEKNGDRYAVADHSITFTKEQLTDEIKKHPEKFSPNVVLRPLYQEMVLPNIAVVGGPGEIAYWLEYKSMFDFYKVPFPCLVLRGSALILDQGIQGKLRKLGFSTDDIFKPSEELIKEYLQRNSNTEFLDEARKHIDSVFEKLATKISEVDSTLKASTDGEKQKALRAIQSLEDKTIRALKRKNETVVSQIEKIKSTLFPEGVMQERHENFMSFYSKWGEDFIETLVRELDPLEKKFFVFLEPEKVD